MHNRNEQMILHTKIQDFEHDEYKEDIYHYSISSFMLSLKFLRPHRLLLRKWTDASPVVSVHKLDRIAVLKTLSVLLNCPAEAG